MADEMQQEMGFEQAEESAPEQQQQTEEMPQQTTEEEGQGNGVGGEDLDDDTEDDRKLFVGGISWESTVKDVREYFEKFGKVAACTLKTDYSTQKSRGFGFVCFASPDAVEKVLAIQDQHKLHGRAIDPKKATPRPKKIFVGKLDPETPESDVQEYFSKFGEVEKIDLPYDKTKEKRRAFCFVEFKKMSSFKKCLEEQSHKIKSQEVDVKKATLQQPGGGGMRGGQRGRGGFGPGSRGGRGGGFQGAYGGGQYQNNYYPPGGYYDPNYYDPQYYNDQYYGNGGYYSGGWNGAGYNQGYNNYGSYGNQPNYGKAQKRGGGQGYHPYNR